MYNGLFHCIFSSVLRSYAIVFGLYIMDNAIVSGALSMGLCPFIMDSAIFSWAMCLGAMPLCHCIWPLYYGLCHCIWTISLLSCSYHISYHISYLSHIFLISFSAPASTFYFLIHIRLSARDQCMAFGECHQYCNTTMVSQLYFHLHL